MAIRPASRSIRRAAYAVILVALAEIVGTLGFHAIEGMGWVNSFYFESMLATGQGPPFPLSTDVGKVFASIMGFVSVGSVLSAVIFILGPLMVRLWRETVEATEREARKIGRALEDGVDELQHELGREPAPTRHERGPRIP